MLCVTEKEIIEPVFSSLYFAFRYQQSSQASKNSSRKKKKTTKRLNNRRDRIDTTPCGISIETHNFCEQALEKNTSVLFVAK